MRSFPCSLARQKVWSRATGDLVSLVTRRLFPDTDKIKEHLDDGNGATFCFHERVQVAVLGPKAKKASPATWNAPELLSVATPDEIRDELLHQCNKLATTRINDQGKQTGAGGIKAVDWDELVQLITRFYLEKVEAQMNHLKRLFVESDKDKNNLVDRAEFEALIKLCVAGREPTEEQVDSLWKASNEIEDDDPDDPDQANAIMFADAFCMACHQQGFYPSPSDRVKRADG